VTVDGIVYCCVRENEDQEKRRDICIGDHWDCTSNPTSTCASAVPATADDFSKRVSSATATLTDQATFSGTVKSTSASRGAAGEMITAAPLAGWIMVAGGTIANAVLLSGTFSWLDHGGWRDNCKCGASRVLRK
jgi:hypothetical protein